MIKLFKKELALNIPKPLYLFWLLGAMILIPNYPVIVGAGYTIMQIFVYLQTSSSYLSQEFSSTLPVKRSDIVSSNTLVIAMFQVVNVAISLLLMPVAQLLYPSGNLAGMDANFTFIGVALICLAGFNSLFIPNYFKTGYKFGKPVVLGLVAFVVIYGACETLIQASPTLKSIFEGYQSTTIVWRIVIMVVGIAIYVVATIFANKRAVKNFEKVNL